MPTEIHIKHPLRSNGSSQISRLVKALSPSYFRLDERSAQDLISAAYEYARILRYHSPDSPVGDNWTCFWEIENLTYMAILAALDTDQIRKDYEKIDLDFGLALKGKTEKKSKKSNSEIEGQYFSRLLRFTRDTARRLERHYQTLRDDIPLKGELLKLIRRDNDKRYEPDDIEGLLQQLIAWHKAWDDRLRPEVYRAFLQEDHRWGVRNRDEYDCILPDESLTDRDQIRALFLGFFNALVAIKARARQLFDAESARLELSEEVESRPLAPHIALFLAFLNLFRHAQDSLNEIPGRHLDFYYDHVLCLHRRPEDPDHAYLIFTLAKEFTDELIEKGTTLLAGKDQLGQPIHFNTLEQWKVTKAQVVDVKGLNHQKSAGRLLALPKEDVLLNDGTAIFRPFADDPDALTTDIGFAVASPQLILREGLRKIQLIFKTVQMPQNDFVRNGVTAVFLSSEEGWEEVAKGDTGTDARYDVETNGLSGFTVSVFLPQDFPSVLSLKNLDKVSGFGPSKWPMVRLNISSKWVNLIEISDLTIKVDVSNVKEHLIIQTDQGLFSGLETVFPFGPIPRKGHRFYLGSTEIFQKALDSLRVRFDWIQPAGDGDFEDYYKGYNGFVNKNNYPSLKINFIDRAIGRDSNATEKVNRSGTLVGNSITLTAVHGDIEEIKVIELNTGREQTIGIDEDEEFAYTLPDGVGGQQAVLRFEETNGAYYPIDRIQIARDGIANDTFELLFEPKHIALSKWTPKKLTIRVLNTIPPGGSLTISIDGGGFITGTKLDDTFTFDVNQIPSSFRARFNSIEMDVPSANFTHFELYFQDASPLLTPVIDAVADNQLNIKLLYFDKKPISYEKIEVVVNNNRYSTNKQGEITIAGIDTNTNWAISPINHPLLQPNGLTVSAIGPSDVEIYFFPINAASVSVLNLENTNRLPIGFQNVEVYFDKDKLVHRAFQTDSLDNSFSTVLLPPGFSYIGVVSNNFLPTLMTTSNLGNTYVPDPANRNYSKLTVRLFEKNEPYPLINKADRLQGEFDIIINSLNLNRDIRTQEFEKYTPTLKRGFIHMTLDGNDFLHNEYSQLLADPEKAKTINPPYSPSANGIAVDYVSIQSVIEDNEGIDELYHTLPFGGFQILPIEAGSNLPLLPSFHRIEASRPDRQIGNLFIGLEAFTPGDNLSLLVQLEEGSEQNFDSLPPKVEWFYLSNNEWKALDAEKILRDSTHQLTRSGVLQLAIPSDATHKNTVLDARYHWLSAKTVEGQSEAVGAFASIKSIRAQALEAVFAPLERSDLSRLEKPLDALTITKLAQSRSAVKKLEQPFSTFGGRRPEADNIEYHRRVSERLRHKDRAVTAWDYEHLLLEQYTQVAIAKCIPHTRYEASGEYLIPSELAPGFVSVAVVPDLLRRPNMVREEPRFSRGDLYEMRDFLLPKTNLFLQQIPAKDDSDVEDHFLQVLNPQYEPICISLKVWLRRGADQNLAKYQINEALRRYLAPWLYDAAQGPGFGRDIRRSKLVQLIEEQDAVDVIQDLRIFQSVKAKFPADSMPVDPSGVIESPWEDFEVKGAIIAPQTARSILTTVLKHQIEIATDSDGGGVAPRRVLAPPPAPASSKKDVSEPIVEPKEEAVPKKAAKSTKPKGKGKGAK